jgi:twitching motility protein PilJ
MVSGTMDHQKDYQGAIAAYANGDYARAVQLFNQAVVVRPDDSELKLWLASAQQQAGQIAEARQVYEEVLETSGNPDLIQAAQNGLDQLNHLATNGELSNLQLQDNDFASTSESRNGGDAFADIDSLFGEESFSESRSSPIIEEDHTFDDLFDEDDSSVATEFSNYSSEDDSFSDETREEDHGSSNQEEGIQQLRSAPTEEYLSTTAKTLQASSAGQSLDDFALLSDFEDPENLSDDPDEATQVALGVDLEFDFDDTDFGSPPGSEAMDDDSSYPTELADVPLSEPIPPPESPGLSSALGDELFDIEDLNKLDSLEQELGTLQPPDQMSELFSQSIDSSASRVASPSPATMSVPAPVRQVVQAPSSAPPSREGTFLQNRNIFEKQLMVTVIQASVSILVGLGVFAVGVSSDPPNSSKSLNPWSVLGIIVGGVTGGVVGYFGLGSSIAKHTRNTTNDLMNNFAALAQGNYSTRSVVRAEDELGRLAASFNQMVSSIELNITELQQRATEQGQAKEDLQRQVIRLLDDVEGAARGDLTVRAEVTADVLGAVADSFNLTIRSLRDIVGQVQAAASAVNDAAFQNEDFARSLSADALRQAEEISSSLNSVQEMTYSIQQVASNAREAAEVSTQASQLALRGGEAVDRTVAGILEIRETVAETTRKVKRLAESSQEISKIVALITQIANRTNLLALNASIEAARAGESGRGFAVVADEVRQLADRAAKASKEIEQIVLQIQSETSSVVTAMAEGTQQVIEGTRRAEQAKDSLGEIIEVSSRIDRLVAAISEATVQQTETSRSVAQVMQTLELTANETSKESQRVASSLMQLVSIARELQSSVGRFRVGS